MSMDVDNQNAEQGSALVGCLKIVGMMVISMAIPAALIYGTSWLFNR